MEPSGGTKTLVDASGLGCIGTPKIVEEEAVPEPNSVHTNQSTLFSAPQFLHSEHNYTSYKD